MLPLTQILIHHQFFSVNKIIIIIEIGQKLGYDSYSPSLLVRLC
jgi:hypothetical protein